MDSKSSPSFFCISAIKLLLIQDIHCIRCNQQFFICWDHYYFHFRNRSRNDCFFTANLAFTSLSSSIPMNSISLQTSRRHSIWFSPTPPVNRIISTPPNAAASSTDIFLNTVIVHLLCKDSFLIASRTSSQEFTHIA